MDNKPFQVLVDDNFHHGDESYRGQAGEYDTLEEAIRVCQEITEASLKDLYRPGMTATQLIFSYQTFGEDPWVLSEQGGVPFSAWKYVEQAAPNFINNQEHYATNY